MPQLSLYLDSEILSKIENGARTSNLSISKYVVNALNEYFSHNWPDDFYKLFGSVHDDSFMESKTDSFSSDASRELL